jgi:hypothetical protein
MQPLTEIIVFGRFTVLRTRQDKELEGAYLIESVL